MDKYEYRDEIKEKLKEYIDNKINLKEFIDWRLLAETIEPEGRNIDLGEIRNKYEYRDEFKRFIDWEILADVIKDLDPIKSPLSDSWDIYKFVTENMQLFELAFYESDKDLNMIGKMFTKDKWEQLEKIMFDYTFEQTIYEVLEDMGCNLYIGKYDKELGGKEKSNLKEIFKQKNLYWTYFNTEDGTTDFEFRVDGKVCWLRHVSVGDDEYDDDYWTDETIAEAIEPEGRNIDLGEVMDEYKYRDEIKEKVKEYIDKKINLKEYWNPQEGMDWDELYSSIYNQINIPSPLPFWHKKEFILENIDTFQAARCEYTLSDTEIGEMFLNEDWDGLEGIIFNYWFDRSIDEVLDEMKEMDIDQLIETKKTLKM